MSDRTPEPLHVAYVMTRFPQISETFILREMQGLVARGHQVSVIAPVLDRSPVRQPGADAFVETMIGPARAAELVGAQLHWLRHHPRRYLRLWADALWGNRASATFLARAALMVPFAAVAARRLDASPVDRLHAHYATHSLLCAWAIWRLTGIPYGVTCHAHDLYVDRTMLRTKLEHASVIITISEFNRRLIAEPCGTDIAARTRVVHCGVDTSELGPVTGDATVAAGAGAEPFRFTVIGSMQPYKGHRHALDAFALLGDAADQCELVLVGDGELRPSLVAHADRLGIAERTRFCGRLPSPEVFAELRAADCVLQPSVVTEAGKMEGIPVALMEALACERPVIASDLSGVSELVRHGDTGVLVPAADPAALAAAMADVIDDPEAHRLMAKRGRRFVEAEFDHERQIDQLLELLTERPLERTTS